jgi:hypothetical protein
MKVYEGICARLNGEPDSQGDILADDVEFGYPVRVTHEFYDKTHVGTAYLERDGNQIRVWVTVDHEAFTPEVMCQLTAVPGGKVLEREGNLIREWKIDSIGLTVSPADSTLPKLKPSMSTGCCEYLGPPFIKCPKCGGRKSC